MLSSKGIYDGKTLSLLEVINVHSPKKVIVTFVNNLDDNEQVRQYASQTDSPLGVCCAYVISRNEQI